MTTAPPAAVGHRPGAELDEVARGGALSLVGAACAGLGGVALTVVVSRGLSPTDAGSFLAVVALFGVVSAASTLGVDAGLGRFMLRLESSRRDADLRRLLRLALLPPVLLAGLLAVVGLVAAGPLASALGLGDRGAALVAVVLLALPCAVGTDLLLSGTRGLGRIRDTVVVDRVLRAGLQPLAVLVALLAGAGLSAVGAAWAGVYAVSAVAAAVVLTRVVATRTPGDRQPTEPDLARSFWSFTAPRGVAQLAQVVVQKADIVVVAAILTPTDAAVYAVATRFVVVAQLVNLAITQVLQPRFTALLVAGDGATLHAVFRAGTTWAVVLVWPALLLVACLPQAYLGLFGADYRTDEAVAVVWLMAAAAMVAVACGPVDTLLLMLGRSARSMTITLVMVAVDLVGLALLVPRWGIAGAAVAWAVALLVRSALTVASVRPHLRDAARDVPPTWSAGVLPLAAAVPLLLVGPADVLAPSWTVPAVVLSGTAYAAGLVVLRRPLGLDVLARALPPTRRRTAGRARPLVRIIGHRLSGPARERVRALVHAGGMLTASWRMTPDIIVVGAQRCGTTTLFRLLSDHPALVRPTLSKGTGYFDDHYDRGPRWYRSHFPLRRPTTAGRRLRTFEVSGFYLPHPLAARRIARDLPGVQVVVLVRDPVERARSAHEHERARGFEDLPLEVAVRAEGVRTAGEVRRLQEDPGYRSAELRHHAYVQRGEYAHQIRRFTDELGADRVHVVDADRFFADPVREYVHLQESLGLPVAVPGHVEVANARPVRPMPAELRRSLDSHFAPHDVDLEALLGRTPSWRQKEDAR